MRNPPANLHEAFIERHRLRDSTGATIADPALNAMADAMKSARAIAEQIAAASVSILGDVTAPQPANALRLKNTAMTLAERAAQALDKGRAKALSELAAIAAATSAPARPAGAVGVQLEAEIRATLRTMNGGDRGKTIAEAIQRGDDSVIGATLRAPGFLSGMSSEEVEMRRATWRRLRHAAEFERETRLKKALEALEAGGKSLVGFARSFSEGEAAQLAEAAQRRARAAERVAAVE